MTSEERQRLLGLSMHEEQELSRAATTHLSSQTVAEQVPPRSFSERCLFWLGLQGDEKNPFNKKWEADAWNQGGMHRLQEEMVECHAKVRVTGVEPKTGSFTLRMKCEWKFTTRNSQEDAEIRLRGVPGIRMPSLIVNVEESRVWKDITQSVTGETESISWRGRSTFSISGFRIFDMLDFPFDRQALDLERLDFVWRPDKDAADHYKSMKIVSFKLDIQSMLPDWMEKGAHLVPHVHVPPPERREVGARLEPHRPPEQKGYHSQFKVHLFIERKHEYHVRQVFFTTFLITIVSVSPLAMPLGEDRMADRLGLYGGGLLTLLAFKYGIADTLPSVPYSTYTDNFLQRQLVVISACCLETLLSFRALTYFEESGQELWDTVENCLFIAILVWWTLYYLYAAHIMPKRRRQWRDIMQEQSDKLAGEFETDGDLEGGLRPGR